MCEKRDKFLIEQMGECWHEWYWFDHHRHVCKHCEMRAEYSDYSELKIKTTNPDFSTWEGFGKLWEWSQRQEWFEQLVYEAHQRIAHRANQEHLWLEPWIQPDAFADSVYAFLKRGNP